MIKWDDLFMNMVHLVSMKSRDPSTHIGAVIVAPDHEVISVGYNGFPRGVEYYDKKRQERPEKYYWYEHAERNAIYNAARRGIQTLGCRMYTSGCPCADCGRAIIQAGINWVMGDTEWDNEDTGMWVEHAARTIIMFREAGVSYHQWQGSIVTPERLYRGEKI